MKGLIKLTLISLGLVCASLSIQAQGPGYFVDALRNSRTNNFGTARTAGLAGSGMALGGDIGTIGLNPAGLGLFNRSQFVFTPAISIFKSDTRFLDNNTPTEETNFDVGNLGLVINFGNGRLNSSGWSSGSLGVTFNRINDFRQNILFRGFNENNSIIDAMLQQANGLFPEQLSGLAQVGFDHYLINPIPGAEDVYDSFILGFPEQVDQITRRGFTDEVKVSYGTNYKDKLYLGASIGFTSTSYTNSRIFTETFENQPISSFTLDERLDVNGTGVNLSLGAIFRPIDMIRIGASYTSPTWYNFSEESDVFYSSRYNNYDVANWLDDNGQRLILEDTVLNDLDTNTPLFISDYNLRTPAKLSVGGAFLFGKYGFITADVEFLDYSNSHISSSDFLAADENDVIDNLFQSTTNIKLGGEARYNVFRIRAGYSRLGDPIVDDFDQLDRSRTILSGGIGLNFGKYFFDLSYSTTSYKEANSSYTLDNFAMPVAITENNLNTTRFTLGLNF